MVELIVLLYIISSLKTNICVFMRILLVVPSFKILGGVANHYMGLSPFWSTKVFYSVYGKRRCLPAAIFFVPDLIVYFVKLIFCDIDVVVVNPSFRKYQLFRDGLYALIALLLGKQLVTFFHGWDFVCFDKVKENPKWFRLIYGNSKFIYVLCSDFKKALIELNLKAQIELTSTKVSDRLIAKFDMERRDGSIRQILFLARIESSKGIFVALDTFKLLKMKYSFLKLSVCGTGSALNEAVNYVKDNHILDVVFHGNVVGEKLIKQFEESDLYILPTEGEGMATSILEAMAFGLPIISRPVGGVKDFFINGDMGYLLESLEPLEYKNAIEKLIVNPSIVKKIEKTNHDYAIKHFLASKVTKKFENDILKYCTR